MSDATVAMTLFIVDDDGDDRDIFCEALREVRPECFCHTASNGRRALMALDNRELEVPNLIFLDVNMPVMNGWQCLAKLKATAAYQHIPVIMYSTSSYAEDVEKAQRSGALCFFTKPSNFTELKKSLALVVDHLYRSSLDTMITNSPLFLTC